MNKTELLFSFFLQSSPSCLYKHFTTLIEMEENNYWRWVKRNAEKDLTAFLFETETETETKYKNKNSRVSLIVDARRPSDTRSLYRYMIRLIYFLFFKFSFFTPGFLLFFYECTIDWCVYSVHVIIFRCKLTFLPISH